MNISNPMIIKSLLRQQNDLVNNFPEGVKIMLNLEDILDIQADIAGPVGTPYEDGLFKVKLVIPADFPNVPPKGYFLTKIFHPNVSSKGEICVNTLKKDWNPKQWSLFHVFQVIRCHLIVPFPESSLNEEAGRLFQENYEEYFKLAKIYVNVHSIAVPISGEAAKTSVLLNESNSRLNIKNNENKKIEPNIILQKALSAEKETPTAEIQPRHAKSEIFAANPVKEEKISMNSFSLIRANSTSNSTNNSSSNTRTNNSKSKQEELKKWLSRL